MGKGEPVEFRIKVPWGHIAAKAWGNKNDTGVLLVHGIMDNIGSYSRLLPLLPDNFYYVAIDLPGHGLSSHMPPGTVLNYFDYVLAINYVLDELQWEHAYYIGHSFGAHLGSFFALVYPGRLKKLVQLDALVAKYYSNDKLIDRIRGEQNLAIVASKNEYPSVYTKEEVLYALKNLRNCCLNQEAAEALFERAVTKVGDDAFIYNRDYRTRNSITPLFSIDQCVYFLQQWKVETLTIFSDNSLKDVQNVKAEISSLLDGLGCIHVVEVKGNHDVHKNYPERVAEHISKFLNHIPSKL